MFAAEEKITLKNIAMESIESGIQSGHAELPDLSQLPSQLCEQQACFVTLTLKDQLRGCIGSLEAYRPLAIDVAENAYAAAFRDYRFSPLTNEELPLIQIQLSVLSPAQAIACHSETELLQQLRPQIDGLIIEDKQNRATFLPSVWQQLPSPEAFLSQLKLKAGLPTNYWSDSIRCFRYQTDYF